MKSPNKILLAKFDCVKEYPADQYFNCGDVKVVRGPAGRYREAEGKPLSRFGYRFGIKNVGRPHLAVIRFPDDKRRFFVINDGTCYDLSSGITTGMAYPLSGKMKETRQVFWPRWNDCSICFMTWGHGEPAAVAELEIYELDDLPALDLPNVPGRRELGIQYEDPCGTGGAEGAITFDQWLDHVVTYARHTGQKLLSYPICWYHGPQFPSQREPADCFSVVVAPDRKQYSAWTTNPPDWPAVILDRFGKEGLEFQGVLTLLRLGSLMQKMNIDLDAIKSGVDTYNNMLWNDYVQTGTNCWTPTYNARNYDKLVEYHEQEKSQADFPWAYGEKPGGPYPPGPMFNPLHPTVQEAIVGFTGEIAKRYGRFPAFKGIAITLWAPTIVWFGSLRAGYDDYTVGSFEKETGVKVPVESNLPNRFSRRFEFLTSNCRKLWIDWRCRKIRDLLTKIRDSLTAVRPDLRLTLNLWSEPFIPAVLGAGEPHQQLHARPTLIDLHRYAGLDMTLFRDEPNIEFDLQLEGGGRDRTAGESPDAPLEKFFMYRDFDFLSESTLRAVTEQRKPGAFIFNAWHEAWGKHKWFRCEPNDPNLPLVSTTYGGKPEGVFRINSEYPKDGFWWDSQLRITHAFPPEPHFLEQYAHALAELDARRITRGGLFLDKAHSDELREFARAFRALPDVKFDTVGTLTDPVAVRTIVHGKFRYLYLVNREYYPVKVTVQFNKAAGKITDLGAGKTISAAKKWIATLKPYQLLSLSLQPKVEVSGFTATAPAKIVQALKKDARVTLANFNKVKSIGRFIDGLDQVAADIQTAVDQDRWSRLRHLLTGYHAFKAREISKTNNEK